MPTPVPVAIRQKIVQAHHHGKSLKTIAQTFQLSFWTVRALWRRFGADAENPCQPHYDRCGPSQPRTDKVLYRAALWLKRRHRGWGAGLVLVVLGQRWPDKPLPHPRTLQRWWRQAELTRPPRQLPTQNSRRAQQVHEVWQMDATSHLRLADGSGASWLALSDECSGAVLEAVAFPPVGLGARPSTAGAAGAAPDFLSLGIARPVARRQRAAVGDARRFAQRSGVVAHRIGD